MKLMGSKGKGKRIAKPVNANNSSKEIRNAAANSNYSNAGSRAGAKNLKKTGRRWSTRKKVIVISACIIGLILIIIGGVFSIVRWEIQPFYDYFFKPGLDVLAPQPVINNPGQPGDSDTIGATDDPEGLVSGTIVTGTSGDENDQEILLFEERKENIITFLILGIDLHGNTDVIMVAAFDSEESTLNVVSIPRDTLVNVPWNLKKANSIHAHARNTFRSENIADGNVKDLTFEHFRSILGFNLDFMITIGMGAFPRIVDGIGGVDFNVPVNINLEGVRISRGNQRLNGQQALIVMRSRNDHASGDIGRANTQQQFLQTVMKQTLAKKDSISVDTMAEIFLRHTNTNIQLNHLVWLGRSFLKMDAENINFHMMPGTYDPLRGDFFIAIQVEPWLEIVNNYLSPLHREITATDVSILTRDSERKLYVTDGNWQGDSSWGASSLGPSNPQTTTDGYTPVN